MMMPAADEDDDFIVQTVVERGASDAQEDGAFGWGLKKLGGFVFAKTDASNNQANAVEPEPTLPPGFSATLNAEEEEIYPAEAKIKVLVAEGNLSGRGRRQAAELHQALQQVVGVAAIYNHLLSKHGGVGTRRKGESSDATGKSGKSAACGCGGAIGSCKAISSLLKEELDKLVKAAETERRGALLKKFRQVERRSGGLCNPDLLEKVVRSSSPSDSQTAPKLPPHVEESPRRPSLSSWGGVGQATATRASISRVGLGSTTASDRAGNIGAAGFDSGGSASAHDVPWADDMLCGASRKRHAAMLKSRGRALAKGLARLLRGVSSDLQGVASRLPPWEEKEDEEEEGEDGVTAGERYAHGRSQSRSSFMSADNADDLADRLSDPKVTPTSTSTTVSVDADHPKSRRQDWKLDAQELSLIRREEERVMKPDVLGNLLAAGAGLGCLQQADFWDVFARLEVATRTEALLNIAMRGGKGCPARSGRMGRELCISLTSVVLEAISTVEQDQLMSHSTHSQPQQQPLSCNDPNGQSCKQQPQRAVAAKQRPSSERFTSQAVLAEARRVGSRARADSVGSGPTLRQWMGGKGGSRGSEITTFHKEDKGLKDLDVREEEFRKAIYVNRSALANRLLQLTHDAPLCAKVLGTFIKESGNAGHGIENRPWTTGRFDSTPTVSSPLARSPGAKAQEDIRERPCGVGEEEPEIGSGKCNGLSHGDSSKCGDTHPSPPLSMASTDPLSDEADDTAAWEQSPPSAEQDGGASTDARSPSTGTPAFRDCRNSDDSLERDRISSPTAPNSPAAF